MQILENTNPTIDLKSVIYLTYLLAILYLNTLAYYNTILITYSSDEKALYHRYQ